MRAVIDTNVAVSAAISLGGPPAAIVRAWRAEAFTWVTSLPLLDEMRRTFARPRLARLFTWSPTEVIEFLDTVIRSGELVRPAKQLDILKDDPSDNRLLEAALAGEADYIVSGDNHLLSLGEYEGVVIVAPARFLAILTALSRE